MELGHDSPERQLNRLIVGLERAFPGARDARTERVVRFHWPTHPFSKGSYACYKVGQWTSIGGAEGETVGKLFFAGEHCSSDFQGYMNGGAESGRVAAHAVLAMLKS
jgi:monoamine oxidase